MKIPILSQLFKKINNFIDSKIDMYRGNISPHLSKAIALVVFILIFWTLSLLCLFFGGLTIALLIAHFTNSYLVGMAIIATIIIIVTAILAVFRQKMVILPIYRVINIALRGKDPLPGDHVVKDTAVGGKKLIPKEEKVKEKPLKEPEVGKKKEIKSILKNVT